MPVMDVRHVGMTVCDRVVLMRMDMRLLSIPREIVLMPVVLVMCMRVRVGHRFMDMHMLVFLGEMQPDSRSHQCPCHPESSTGRLVQ